MNNFKNFDDNILENKNESETSKSESSSKSSDSKANSLGLKQFDKKEKASDRIWNNKIVVGTVTVIIVSIVGIGGYLLYNKYINKPQPVATPVVTEKKVETTPTVPATPITDYDKNLPVNTTKVNYKIKRTDTVRGIIVYEKKRAVSGDGLELYWLDATYKDKPYRVQIDMEVYNLIEDKGELPVKMKVRVLDDGKGGNGKQIIDKIELADDYKSYVRGSGK